MSHHLSTIILLLVENVFLQCGQENVTDGVRLKSADFPGHRARHNDFKLEEDKDKAASLLPTASELLITCHLPLSRGLHAAFEGIEKVGGRAEEIWKRGR